MENNKKVVMTLDAGGTNFVFSAICNKEYVVEPIGYPSNAHELDLCLATLVKGFEEVKAKLTVEPVAISFAFPGPADYPNGIIGGYLPNFPSFRDGVALGPFLQKKFGIPVYINNDGDLYAYGEAMEGKLPEINEKLEKLGSTKRYNNLIGYTFGTGFGVGFVDHGKLHIGDNSCVETFCLEHKEIKDNIVEDGVSVRAVKRVYAELSGDKDHKFEPKDIYDIAEGKIEGNKEAAVKAFEKMGEVAGAAMATAVTLFDGLIVIGGGITAAKKYIMPALVKEMRRTINTLSGDTISRIPMKVYNLDDEEEFKEFAKGHSRRIKVYGYDDEVDYDDEKRIGVCTTGIGASRAISLGAAAYALNKIAE